MNAQTQKHQVVIVGAGFGGLRAARGLAKADVQVTLIDRNNYHLFQPLLYQVATAGISADEIAYPVRAIFRRQSNFSFRLAAVNEIDPLRRRLLTTAGEVYYDTLILAAGGQTHYFGLETVAHNSFGLKTLDEAAAIRNHLLRQFELADQASDPRVRSAHLSFVIVGGGPTGVEMAGAISELVQMVLANDYPQITPAEVQVILMEGTHRLLPAMPQPLSQAAADALTRQGVQVRFGAQVSDYDGAVVTLNTGEILPAFTVVWAAGIWAVPLVAQLGAALGSLGRVKVEPSLQVPGHPEIYVIGDAAYLEDAQGKPLPMIAPVAMQQGAYVAGVICARLRQRVTPPFTYRDRGSMATIGRRLAVAQLGRWQLSGTSAWLAWLLVHLMALVRFENRLLVLTQWAWHYLTWNRNARLITRDAVSTTKS